MTTGVDTGFFDEHGRPASWAAHIDEWEPTTSDPVTLEPDEQPF